MPQSHGTEPGGVGVMGRFSSAQSRCFCQLHGPHTSHGSVSDMSSSSRQSSLKSLVLPTPGKGSFIKIKHYPTVKSHLTRNISIVSPPRSQLYVSRGLLLQRPSHPAFPLPGWDSSQRIPDASLAQAAEGRVSLNSSGSLMCRAATAALSGT